MSRFGDIGRGGAKPADSADWSAPARAVLAPFQGLASEATSGPPSLGRPLVVTSIDCDAHRTPDNSHESNQRVAVIRLKLHEALDAVGSADWAYVRAGADAVSSLPALVHSGSYLRALDATLRSFDRHPPGMGGPLPDLMSVDCSDLIPDGDTFVSEGTAAALLATCEALRVAVSAVLRGERLTAAVITRPPGHHCSHFTRLNQGQMGFCILNTAMQAARFAQLQAAVELTFLKRCIPEVPGVGAEGPRCASEAAPADAAVDSSATVSDVEAAARPLATEAHGQCADPRPAAGLRVAIVDIDAHVGNGSQVSGGAGLPSHRPPQRITSRDSLQGLLLAIARQLGLAEHVWSYDPAAPPPRTARSKRVLTFHHRRHRRAMELPAGSVALIPRSRTALMAAAPQSYPPALGSRTLDHSRVDGAAPVRPPLPALIALVTDELERRALTDADLAAAVRTKPTFIARWREGTATSEDMSERLWAWVQISQHKSPTTMESAGPAAAAPRMRGQLLALRGASSRICGSDDDASSSRESESGIDGAIDDAGLPSHNRLVSLILTELARRSMTQSGFAAATGLTPAQISNWKGGKLGKQLLDDISRRAWRWLRKVCGVQASEGRSPSNGAAAEPAAPPLAPMLAELQRTPDACTKSLPSHAADAAALDAAVAAPAAAFVPIAAAIGDAGIIDLVTPDEDSDATRPLEDSDESGAEPCVSVVPPGSVSAAAVEPEVPVGTGSGGKRRRSSKCSSDSSTPGESDPQIARPVGPRRGRGRGGRPMMPRPPHPAPSVLGAYDDDGDPERPPPTRGGRGRRRAHRTAQREGGGTRPPVCWRGNRLYYRQSPLAGVHAGDFGRSVHGWRPVGWTGQLNDAAASAIGADGPPQSVQPGVAPATAASSTGGGLGDPSRCSRRVEHVHDLLSAGRPVGLPLIDVSRAGGVAGGMLGATSAESAAATEPPVVAATPGPSPLSPAVAQQLLFVSIHQYHPVHFPSYSVAHDGVASGDAAARIYTPQGWMPGPDGWVSSGGGDDAGTYPRSAAAAAPAAAMQAPPAKVDEARVLFDAATGKPSRRWEPHYWKAGAAGEPRFPLAILQPPSRTSHWLADVSLPVDISWTNGLGAELASDSASSDDSGSRHGAAAISSSLQRGVSGGGSSHFSPRRGLSGGAAAASQSMPAADDELASEEPSEAEQPMTTKSALNPGSLVWRQEIQVRDARPAGREPSHSSVAFPRRLPSSQHSSASRRM